MSSTTIKRKFISSQTFVMMFGLLLGAALFATPTRAQSFQVGLGLPREGTQRPISASVPRASNKEQESL